MTTAITKTTDNILEIYKDGIDIFGFWQEQYKSTVMAAIEGIFKPGIISEWKITDFVIKDKDTVLIKWQKKRPF